MALSAVLRQQVPVHSPLPLAAIAAGLAAARGSGAEARARVRAWLLERFGPRDVLLTDSGTTALALALRGVASASGRALVALPAYCCYDVATAADAAGVEVVLYDLDPASLGPDWDSLRAALDAGVSALVVAELYGVPLDLEAIRRLADEAGAILIEDAAQGVGVRYGDRWAGALGALGVLSFGRGKGLTGCGGGALLLNPDRDPSGLVESAFAEARCLLEGAGGRSQGRFRQAAPALAQWALARPGVYALPASLPLLRLGETIYRVPTPPAEMSAFTAGVLGVTSRLVDAESEIRRRNAERLLRVAEGGAAVRVPRGPSDATPGYLRFPLVMPAGAAVGLGDATARRLGVMPGYPTTLARLAGFGDGVRNTGARFPGAELLAAGLRTVPTHGLLRGRDLAGLEEWLLAVG